MSPPKLSYRWSTIKLLETLAHWLPLWWRLRVGGQYVGSSFYYKVSLYPWVQMFSLKSLSTVTSKVSGINKGSSYSKVQEPLWQPFCSPRSTSLGSEGSAKGTFLPSFFSSLPLPLLHFFLPSFPYLLWEFPKAVEWKERVVITSRYLVRWEPVPWLFWWGSSTQKSSVP